MAAPPDVTPAYYQILVVRELRKAGLDVSELRVHRRSELPEPQRGFVVELTALLRHRGRSSRALIACYCQDDPVRADIVTRLPERITASRAELGVVVSTADFAADAVVAAQQATIVPVRVADARSAYDASGWSAPGHYPAWLPAHVLQLADGRPLDAQAFGFPT